MLGARGGDDGVPLINITAAWALAELVIAIGVALALARIHRSDHEYWRRGVTREVQFGLWQTMPVLAAALTAVAIFTLLATTT
jgi:hypothetical protein